MTIATPAHAQAVQSRGHEIAALLSKLAENSIPPADAGPPPEGGGTYFQVRVLGLGGWLSELSEGYP